MDKEMSDWIDKIDEKIAQENTWINQEGAYAELRDAEYADYDKKRIKEFDEAISSAKVYYLSKNKFRRLSFDLRKRILKVFKRKHCAGKYVANFSDHLPRDVKFDLYAEIVMIEKGHL